MSSDGAAPTEGDAPRWERVVLKLSGEAFAGDAGYGVDGAIVKQIAEEIVEVRRELAVDVRVDVGVGDGQRMRGHGGDLTSQP